MGERRKIREGGEKDKRGRLRDRVKGKREKKRRERGEDNKKEEKEKKSRKMGRITDLKRFISEKRTASKGIYNLKH